MLQKSYPDAKRGSSFIGSRFIRDTSTLAIPKSVVDFTFHQVATNPFKGPCFKAPESVPYQRSALYINPGAEAHRFAGFGAHGFAGNEVADHPDDSAIVLGQLLCHYIPAIRSLQKFKG